MIRRYACRNFGVVASRRFEAAGRHRGSLQPLIVVCKRLPPAACCGLATEFARVWRPPEGSKDCYWSFRYTSTPVARTVGGPFESQAREESRAGILCDHEGQTRITADPRAAPRHGLCEPAVATPLVPQCVAILEGVMVTDFVVSRY